MQNLMELSEKLGLTLLSRNLTISAAESCTGGLLLSTLTDISGSSRYVLGGFVTYSNAAKMQFLGVEQATLDEYGAVSDAVAREMARGAQESLGADIAVSITGIAGPGGGTPEKPVGLVYIGVAYKGNVHVQQNLWSGDRVENKQQSVAAAIQWVEKNL